jgi:hypothetical protein
MLLDGLPDIIRLAAVFCENNDAWSESIEPVSDVKVAKSVLLGKHGD